MAPFLSSIALGPPLRVLRAREGVNVSSWAARCVAPRGQRPARGGSPLTSLSQQIFQVSNDPASDEFGVAAERNEKAARPSGRLRALTRSRTTCREVSTQSERAPHLIGDGPPR